MPSGSKFHAALNPPCCHLGNFSMCVDRGNKCFIHVTILFQSRIIILNDFTPFCMPTRISFYSFSTCFFIVLQNNYFFPFYKTLNFILIFAFIIPSPILHPYNFSLARHNIFHILLHFFRVNIWLVHTYCASFVNRELRFFAEVRRNFHFQFYLPLCLLSCAVDI